MALAGYLASEKLDGVRGYWDGRRLWTRGGGLVAAPAWFTAGWPNIPMDGELWVGRGRFIAAQSIVSRDVPDDSAWRTLRFMAFDLPAQGGPFAARHAALLERVAGANQPWLQAVAQTPVADDQALQALLRSVVAAGGEGLMLRRAASLHRSGRSDDLLKLKLHDDAEARVVAHQPGLGKYAGLMGALLVEMPSGQRFSLGTGFTDAERRDPPPVGSTVTYRHHGAHPGGLPRFASFMRVRTL